MFTHKLIGGGVAALAAFSFATIPARADPGAQRAGLDDRRRDGGFAKLAGSPRAMDVASADWFELRRGLCELGARPQRLSEKNLELCVRQSP